MHSKIRHEDIPAQTVFKIGDFAVPFDFETAVRYRLLRLRLTAKDSPSDHQMSLCPFAGKLLRSGATNVVVITNLCPGIRQEHRLRAPHACELPSHRHHRRLPLPSRRLPRTRFLLRAIPRRSQSRHVLAWIILAHLPIARRCGRRDLAHSFLSRPVFSFEPVSWQLSWSFCRQLLSLSGASSHSSF